MFPPDVLLRTSLDDLMSANSHFPFPHHVWPWLPLNPPSSSSAAEHVASGDREHQPVCRHHGCRAEDGPEERTVHHRSRAGDLHPGRQQGDPKRVGVKPRRRFYLSADTCVLSVPQVERAPQRLPEDQQAEPEQKTQSGTCGHAGRNTAGNRCFYGLSETRSEVRVVHSLEGK